MFNPAIKNSHLLYDTEGFITLMGPFVGTISYFGPSMAVFNLGTGYIEYIGKGQLAHRYRFLRYV